MHNENRGNLVGLPDQIYFMLLFDNLFSIEIIFDLMADLS